MSNRNPTKLTCRCASALLAISLLAGCSGNPSAPSNTSPSSSVSPSSSAAPASGTSAPSPSEAAATTAERKKLTIGVPQNPNVQDFETNYITTLLEEQMNVDIDFVLFPNDSSDRTTKLALFVSSNSQLPDVLSFSLAELDVYNYGSKGVFNQLDDYWNNPEIAVNAHKMDTPENIETLKQSLKSADGHIYSLANYVKSGWTEGGWRCWINKEWLSALNLEMPATTDDLHNVLKAFAESDPNGNGKKDEIPMIGSNNGWAQDPTVFLMNAFIYTNPDKYYTYIENGKVLPSFTTPEWKEGMTYISQLISEGLLSPLSFTQDSNQLKALGTSETAVIGVAPAGSITTFGTEGTPICDRMTLMSPLTGPNGVCNVVQNLALPTQLWFITRDCDDPEFAFRVGDHFYEREFGFASRYGIEGEHWTRDPEIMAQYVVPEPELMFAALIGDNPWNQPGNIHWQGTMPYYESMDMARTGIGVRKKDDPTAYDNKNITFAKIYQPLFPKENVLKFSFTPEETERFSILKTSIHQFVKDNLVAFVCGNRPLSEWDKYLKELDNLGLEEYMQMLQNSFDRLSE